MIHAWSEELGRLSATSGSVTFEYSFSQELLLLRGVLEDHKGWSDSMEEACWIAAEGCSVNGLGSHAESSCKGALALATPRGSSADPSPYWSTASALLTLYQLFWSAALVERSLLLQVEIGLAFSWSNRLDFLLSNHLYPIVREAKLAKSERYEDSNRSSLSKHSLALLKTL